MSDSRSRNLCFKLGFCNSLAVSSDGLCGGLVLFWDEAIKVSLLSQGEGYIDVLIQDDTDTGPWRATFVYGEPRVENRHDMWERMRTLCGQWLGPWMVIVDFNEAMWQYEHFSNNPRPERQMLDFCEVLSHCVLHDLGFSGLPWTYNNNQSGDRNVRVRLDRAVSNSEWVDKFTEANVQHLSSPQSDHKVLFFSTTCTNSQVKPLKIFRYEIMWERESDLGTVIEKAWLNQNPGSDLGVLADGLKAVTRELKIWSRNAFGNVTRQMEDLRREPENLERSDPIGNRGAVLSTKRELDDLLYKEEMMWLQRSRLSWLKERDRNTKYFHQRARWRARKNFIKRLKRNDGSWCSDQADLQGMAGNYFTDMFMKDENVNPLEVEDLFEPTISDAMNLKLCKPYSSEEISDALFQIGPLKAPGPAGYASRFFQRNWATFKDDIVQAVQEFFRSGTMIDGVNEMCIVLLPKVQQPETLIDLRPISLCNILYKVVSKCMVNRLRPSLQNIISPSQSAFIPGRLITDNAIMAFECLHAICSTADERSKFCAYKLDLSKAYDRVDWGFLNKVILKLGFQREWVDRIMTCVTSVSYTIRFNGVVSAAFTPTPVCAKVILYRHTYFFLLLMGCRH